MSSRLRRVNGSCRPFHSRYDGENRLTALSTGGTSIGVYAYDGAGDRIAKTTSSGTTAYTLDLASALPQVIAETTGSSTTTYAFAGGPLELDQAGSTYWYQTDTLGSVRLLTDTSGNSASSYNYSAFGATRTSSGSVANEVRFSGERTDTESGLEFLRARTYDPSTGTFLQRDTVGVAPSLSQSLNRYGYVLNDPANHTDPRGHDIPMGGPACVLAATTAIGWLDPIGGTEAEAALDIYCGLNAASNALDLLFPAKTMPDVKIGMAYQSNIAATWRQGVDTPKADSTPKLRDAGSSVKHPGPNGSDPVSNLVSLVGANYKWLVVGAFAVVAEIFGPSFCASSKDKAAQCMNQPTNAPVGTPKPTPTPSNSPSPGWTPQPSTRPAVSPTPANKPERLGGY